MVFQAEIYAIKAFITENTEKGYKCKKIYILSHSQAAIKALDSFKMNSKLVLDRHQSWCNWQDITESDWYGCLDTWELMEMK